MIARDGRDGRDGAAGESAYKVAVRLGYRGTEAQWLRELHGKDGAPGESAFRLAVKNGFQGSELDWLATFKGEKGDPGEDGKDAPVPKYYEFVLLRDDFDRLIKVIATPFY